MISKNRNTVLLLALVNVLLTPVYFYLSGLSSPKPLMAVNYAIIAFAGYQICSLKKINISYVISSLVVLSTLAVLTFYPENRLFICLKAMSLGLLFYLIFKKLLLALWDEKEVGRDSIMGTAAGYILIGLFAAQLYEIIYYLIPHSFNLNLDQVTDFQFFYYSFTGVTTVGFGDITPTNPQAQSITVIMNIIGQLYLTVVMAMFVGKFLNSKHK